MKKRERYVVISTNKGIKIFEKGNPNPLWKVSRNTSIKNLLEELKIFRKKFG